MKKTIRNLICLVCVFFLLGAVLTGCGKNEDETLSIKMESAEETEDGMAIVFVTRNNAGSKVSLGWAGGCEIEVTTTEDTYYYEPFMTEIPRGKGEMAIVVEDCEGEIRKIVITELCLLDADGLPGRKIRDAVVFDEKKDIEEFEDSFSFFSSVSSVFGLIFVIAIIAMIGFGVFLGFAVVRGQKANKAASQQFKPYGAPSHGADFQQMHQNAHQMHVDAHQRFVQQEVIRQHTEFAHQSVTPIDQGGFVPPPPPPPPPGM